MSGLRCPADHIGGMERTTSTTPSPSAVHRYDADGETIEQYVLPGFELMAPHVLSAAPPEPEPATAPQAA